MHLLAALAAAFVVTWAVLVVVAQVLNPDQSPLTMGMSGLARGRAPWVMKASFIVRGLSALLLVAALPADLRIAGLVLVGVGLLWVWGVGSAALALADTDMPGEAPTPTGAAHALIALVAYIAGVVGAMVLSYTMLHNAGLSGIATLALPISITAAAALVVQFVAFGAAAREAQAAAPAATAAPAAPFMPPSAAPAEPAPPSAAPALVRDVPPQIGAETRVASVASQGTRPAAAAVGRGALHDLASYAGLYQRLFVGLLMAWTLLVALGLLSS
jgi:hypothetical membrane protein